MSVFTAEPVVLTEFDFFYDLYPRKVAKAYARKIFTKALTKTTAQTIMQALQAQIAAGMFSDSREFIPHPSTWLAQERWGDEVVVMRPAFRNGALAALARLNDAGPMLEHGDD